MTVQDGVIRAPQRVVMITTSYPRFPGDTVGTFLEPIAHGVARLGHEVHVVLPWHPRLVRPAREENVYFHPFRYAPVPALNVFGYAESLHADVRLRLAATIAAPLALASAWQTTRRVARETRATLIHAHWVIPGGAIGALVAHRYPLVVSLHGSDVFVAEHHRAIGAITRRIFRRCDWVTACSDDLRRRAIDLDAPAERSETIPYGVDAGRFSPDAEARTEWRNRLGLDARQLLVVTAGRLVRKKGFEYLIDAIGQMLAARGVEKRQVTQADGLGISQDFLHYFSGGLRDELVKAGVARQVVHEGDALAGVNAGDTVLLEGKLIGYKNAWYGIIVKSEITLYRRSDNALLKTMTSEVGAKASPFNTDKNVGESTGKKTAYEIRKVIN